MVRRSRLVHFAASRVEIVLLALCAAAIPSLGSVATAGSGSWIVKNEDPNYTARHECSFVQAGQRFYLFGGRENAQTLDTYDYATDDWTTSATAPIEFNHFQATEYQGLIWVIGAFETNSFPVEAPADHVWVFDPARDVWMEGPVVPANRRRGSTGLVVHDGKFYIVGGNTIGHDGGYVSWFDAYDPRTGDWTPLADAPGPRDHFHAAVAGGKLYAVGGRLTGGSGGVFGPLVPEVDVYDFSAGSWSRLPSSENLPTPRAASAVAWFGGEILVIGGEGNGQAYDTVEGYDPVSGNWTTRASLNFERHGTQAIVSGQGVYVTAGSPVQGGGNQRKMEVYDADAPSGVASVAGVLSAPGAATVTVGSPATIGLTHVGGNEGVFVNEVTLTGPDAWDFEIADDVDDPFLILASGQRDLSIQYTGNTEGATATLEVTHGGGVDLSVALTGSLGAGLPGEVAGLTLDRSGADLDLAWGADCGTGNEFGIYRGNLSLGYASIAIDSCNVNGTAAAVSIGLPDGEFFLVVPSRGATEGSYGQTTACLERPAALGACHPTGQLDQCACP